MSYLFKLNNTLISLYPHDCTHCISEKKSHSFFFFLQQKNETRDTWIITLTLFSLTLLIFLFNGNGKFHYGNCVMMENFTVSNDCDDDFLTKTQLISSIYYGNSFNFLFTHICIDIQIPIFSLFIVKQHSIFLSSALWKQNKKP
jgi:hypothetical protein